MVEGRIAKKNKTDNNFWCIKAAWNRIFSYLHCAWKYLMRFCSRSTPFLILISLTLSRYWKDIKHRLILLYNFNFKWKDGVTQITSPSDWPHTSGAGRTSSPSPSPLRFPPHWFPSWSSRAAVRVPSSPSLSWCCKWYQRIWGHNATMRATQKGGGVVKNQLHWFSQWSQALGVVGYVCRELLLSG